MPNPIASHRYIIFLHFFILLNSLSGVMIKMSANTWQQLGKISPHVILLFSGALFLLGIYAIYWQYMLSHSDLSQIYPHVAANTGYSLIWSVVFFGDAVSAQQIIGIGIIMLGIVVIQSKKYEY